MFFPLPEGCVVRIWGQFLPQQGNNHLLIRSLAWGCQWCFHSRCTRGELVAAPADLALKVCVMTHRAPLSPRSTNHEPWPLIPHMRVWDVVAAATDVCPEALSRRPWIAGSGAKMAAAAVGGCEGKMWKHHEWTGLYLSDNRLHPFDWSLSGQWGLCLREKNLCHPSFLMLPLHNAPLSLNKFLPPCLTCANYHVGCSKK